MGQFLADSTPGHAVRLTPSHILEARDLLDAGHCVVWIINVDHAGGSDTGLQPQDPLLPRGDDQWLDQQERVRAHGFVVGLDRRRYTASHMITRALLGGLSTTAPQDIVFDRRPCARCGETHGKPEIRPTSPRGAQGEALRFSTSRSDRLLAIAVRGDTDVGIDIEVRPAGEDLAALRDSVEARGDEAGDLLERWVRKEAFLKATGEGLTRPMTSLALRRHRADTWCASPDEQIDVRDLRALRVTTDDRIVAAVAGIRPLGNPRVFTVDEG